MKQPKFLMALDIQKFSAENGEGEQHNEQHEQQGENQTETNTGGEPGTNPEVKFTQADIDRIVKERLDREKRKRDEALEAQRKEDERKRLEEEQKYKELYEKLQQDLEAQRATSLQVKKESLLAQAGYSEEQAKTLTKLIEGDDDEALKASLESVKALFPPKREKPYGDPNPGNGGKQTPKPKDLEDKGRAAFERLKKLGKVKGKN